MGTIGVTALSLYNRSVGGTCTRRSNGLIWVGIIGGCTNEVSAAEAHEGLFLFKKASYSCYIFSGLLCVSSSKSLVLIGFIPTTLSIFSDWPIGTSCSGIVFFPSPTSLVPSLASRRCLVLSWVLSSSLVSRVWLVFNASTYSCTDFQCPLSPSKSLVSHLTSMYNFWICYFNFAWALIDSWFCWSNRLLRATNILSTLPASTYNLLSKLALLQSSSRGAN